MVSFFRYTKTKTAWRMVDGPFGLRETKEMRDSRGIAALYSPSPKSPKKKKNVIQNHIEKHEKNRNANNPILKCPRIVKKVQNYHILGSTS